MSTSLDELYALVLDGAPRTPLHGDCAEKKYGDDFPTDATPVFFGDLWRGEVKGICPACGLFVDPSAP